jgi:hypothetical protein
MLKTKSGSVRKRAKRAREKEPREQRERIGTLEVRDLRFEDMGFKLAKLAVPFFSQCSIQLNGEFSTHLLSGKLREA